MDDILDQFNGTITAIHKEKDMFILFSSGLLMSLNRNLKNKIQLTPITSIWANNDFEICASAYFKQELILFFPMMAMTILQF